MRHAALRTRREEKDQEQMHLARVEKMGFSEALTYRVVGQGVMRDVSAGAER